VRSRRAGGGGGGVSWAGVGVASLPPPVGPLPPSGGSPVKPGELLQAANVIASAKAQLRMDTSSTPPGYQVWSTKTPLRTKGRLTVESTHHRPASDLSIGCRCAPRH